ncbi:MAG: metallophosphoesterase [Candidatus Aenigmarchaeota archaeon]|nr:metallophosphoesterase [Candidatus Aenigmarchaeota archaeon]
MAKVKVDKNIYIPNGYRALYLKDTKTVVISDLQLGYELYLAKSGIFVPQTQLQEMIEDIKKIHEITKAKTLVINGDLKHEFGEASKQEWREVKEFIGVSAELFKEIILVRGNHDNYLLNIISKLGIELHDPYYIEKRYLFTHGHKLVDIPAETEVIIIGHEEPAIVTREGFDMLKIPCLLKGSFNDKTLVVLPAFSKLSSGSEINVMDKKDFLSPYLKNANIEEFEVFGIDSGITVYLGKIKNLRRVL